MANEIIDTVTPDYITHEGWTSKRERFAFPIPVALAATEIFIVSSFEDRVGEAIAASAATLVKVDAAGAPTAIAAGDDLNGYRIGYQSAGVTAIDTDIDVKLDYYSAI